MQTGLFAKPVGEGDVVYLQVRHFDENGQLTADLYPDLLGAEISEKHFLQEGDILFSAKGTKNFAAIYAGFEEQCVASTSFFVIRLKEVNLLPAYLAWYLNHPNTQQTLKAQAKGSSIVSISKTQLEDLEINIPDLHTQELVLQIANLRNKEKLLKQQIETLREKQIQQQLQHIIQGR